MYPISGVSSSPDKTAIKATAGRRYFYVNEWVRNIWACLQIGILFGLPIVVAYFSLKYAFAFVILLMLSYFIGELIYSFDQWYNSERKVGDETILEKHKPTSELEILLDRLYYFESKYWCSIKDMYRYLELDVVPFDNNLDWIEMVSLLNQLSLHVGKRFEEEAEDGKGMGQS